MRVNEVTSKRDDQSGHRSVISIPTMITIESFDSITVLCYSLIIRPLDVVMSHPVCHESR
jgi:hypothetical protein